MHMIIYAYVQTKQCIASLKLFSIYIYAYIYCICVAGLFHCMATSQTLRFFEVCAAAGRQISVKTQSVRVPQVILDGSNNVGNPIINLPFEDGLYNPFMVILGTV